MTKDKSNKSKTNKELDELRLNYAKLQTEYLRLQSINQKDEELLKKSAIKSFIKALTPVVDSFYRSSQHCPDLTNSRTITNEQKAKLIQYIEGTKLIEKQLEEALATVGLTRIKAKGEIFNHELHEAITSEKSDLPEETIIDEIEAGWVLGSEVIKPAKVRVSAGSKITDTITNY